MSDLTALIERLEKATGSDRQIDCEIAWETGWDIKSRTGGNWREAFPQWRGDEYRTLGASDNWGVPCYTASLDGATALVERVLPGCCRASGKTSLYPGMVPGSSPFKFWAEIGDWGSPARAGHDIEPIAILIALLRAIEAQGGGT